MVDLSLQVGEEANAQETALIMFGLSSVLQWCFLIIIAIIVAMYIRKENAIRDKKKHSHKNHRKGR